MKKSLISTITATAIAVVTIAATSLTSFAADISLEQAIDIALKDAGYTKKDTLYVNVKKDFDDGMEVYEIEFRVGFVEYNYDINVANGQIVDFEIDD